MFKISDFLLVVILLQGMVFSADRVEKPLNLFPGKLKAVYMDNEPTGLYGWTFYDNGRINQVRDSKRSGFLDGRECFKLDFSEQGVFTIRLTGTADDEYYQNSWNFYPYYFTSPEIPADSYWVRGAVKLDKGSFTPPGSKALRPAAEWQYLDYQTPQWGLGFRLNIKRGMNFSFKDFSYVPIYHQIGGSIRLPNGGELSKFVMPEDAPFYLKRTVHCWRGWFWKLTGTALPVYEAKTPKPEPGAFVFIKGKTAPGGFQLHISKTGATLVYDSPFAANTALFEYLREHGVIVYNRNSRIEPERNPQLTLKATDQISRPKFALVRPGSSIDGGEYAGLIHGRSHVGGWANWYIGTGFTEYHISNQLMPPPQSRQEHPESQMMFENGKRQTLQMCKNNMLISPCLTDPYTRTYMLERWNDWMKAFDYCTDFGFCLGDMPNHFCHCESCRAKNSDKTHKTYAAVMLDYMNEVADAMGKRNPEQSVVLGAYHTYAFLPEGAKVSDNLKVIYCIVSSEKGCNIHLDCEKNLRWRQSLEKWSQAVGRENIDIALYDNHNPLLLIEFLEILNKYASRQLQVFTSSMNNTYIASRWSQGDDPKTIVSEYNNGVYGKAGMFMTDIDRVVYDFNRNYTHMPNERVVTYGRIQHLSALDRVTFDKIYNLFNGGQALVQGETKYEIPLLWEKLDYLVMDLMRFPRSEHHTGKDLREFALRTADFIRTCDRLAKDRRYPYRLANEYFSGSQIPARTFLQTYCGIEVPNTVKYWTEEELVKEFLKDPGKNMSSEPEKMPGSWRFSAAILRGGEHHPGGVVLRRNSSGKGRVAAVWNLDHSVKGTALLTIAGWDDEKPGQSTFEVIINGKIIYAGENTFPESSDLKNSFGGMYFPIPESMLKEGENVIEFVNTVKDDPVRTIRELANKFKPEDGFTEKQDYFWGWLAIKEVRLTVLDDEYMKYANGEVSAWDVWTTNKPLGIIEATNGIVSIKAQGARFTGIWIHPTNNNWIFPAGVKFQVRINASGTGKFTASILGYPTGDDNRRTNEAMFSDALIGELSTEPKQFEQIITHKKRGLCAPAVYLLGEGKMKIHSFSLEPVK